MSNKELHEEVKMRIPCFRVKETTRDGDDWNSANVYRCQESIDELMSGDENPMFVSLVAFQTGESLNGLEYDHQCADDLAQKIVGTNSYLGHADPATEDFAYREPVAKTVAARSFETTDDKGQRQKATEAKLYISKAAPNLRTHLREKMAGPVSIDCLTHQSVVGDRRRALGIKKVLSLDFCNPGRQGIPVAGSLLKITKEMKTEDNDTTDTKDNDMKDAEGQLERVFEMKVDDLEKKVTRAQETIIALRRESAAKDEALKKSQARVSEMSAALKELSGELAVQKSAANLAALKDYAASKFEDLGNKDSDIPQRIVEMASDDFQVKGCVADDDDAELTKSKKLVDRAIEIAITKYQKISEKYGIGLKDEDEGEGEEHVTETKTVKKRGSKGGALKSILNPALSEVIAKHPDHKFSRNAVD